MKTFRTIMPARSTTLTVADGNQAYNSVVMTTTAVSPAETSPVGTNIPLFDSMDTTGAKFVVNGSGPGPGEGMYQAHGSVFNFSITVVPEPGGTSALVNWPAVAAG